MEEVLSHSGASPQIPFRFGRTSQLPSESQYTLSLNETAQLPPRMEGAIVFR